MERMIDSYQAMIVDNWYIANVQQKVYGDILNIQQVGQTEKYSNREDPTPLNCLSDLTFQLVCKLKTLLSFNVLSSIQFNPNCFYCNHIPVIKWFN
jgi:hypothetical protein